MIDISWLVNHRVLLIIFGDIVTQDDALEMNRQIIAYFEDSPHDANIHLLFIEQKMRDFPKNITWIRQHITFLHHSKCGYNFTVTKNPLIRFIGVVGYKAFNKNTPIFFSTYENARQELMERDPLLPPLPKSIDQ
ncbi:MAG: hypothetical protein WBC91_08865 [Phototrophicaceae bacterium]